MLFLYSVSFRFRKTITKKDLHMAGIYLGSPKLMDMAKYVYSGLRFFRKFYRQPAFFVFNDQEYAYFEHPYNGTWMNERAVEIPLMWEQLKSYSPERVLEVGNVLSHYFVTKHAVVDKYERRPGVISNDILDVELPQKFDCIVSISTLEHIGWDETPRVPGKHISAIMKMKQLLSVDGKLFATVPLGYNPSFDQDLFSGKLGCSQAFYFKRLTKETWCQASLDQVRASRYGEKYRTTDGLAVCMWQK
jgi:hypothetical protein